MSKLFILGAGFSKALHQEMPTLWELSQKAIAWNDLPLQIPEVLKEDVEQLLSYLYQNMPWLRSDEIHLHKSAFVSISRQISEFIHNKEVAAFDGSVPEWGEKFVHYLHQNRSTIATLNYDVLVEQLATLVKGPGTHHPHIMEGDMYRLPIAILWARTAGVTAGESINTFRLLKLHGSTNWYYPGETGTSVSSQVYYEPVRKLNGGNDEDQEELKMLRLDLEPLIIPPVADKAVFYGTPLVKVLWSEFRKAIEIADEIYCVGYSLPKTDLTMRLFLKANARVEQRVFLVNNSTGKYATDLVDNYKDVFKDADINIDFLGQPNSVELMVNHLCAS